jgi:molecular chaperone Hsp33
VLEGLSQEEIESSMEDGLIKVTCEFCSTTYRFEASEVRSQ